MNEIKGTGVALVTPFKANHSIDFGGLSKLVEHLIQGGVNYLVVLGTTGESATQSEIEKNEVLAHVKKVNKGRLPIVLGMGGNNTLALASQMENLNPEGIAAILSASPYYNKPSQEGIYQHYKVLAEKSPLPIILYNVPGRTSSNITAETCLRLANDFKNIVGIKEASGDLIQVMEIIKNKDKDFLVISGEDALTFPIVACGGDGVISVVANTQPKLFSSMVQHGLKGNLTEAGERHYALMSLMDLLFREGNPGGVKAALKSQGICSDYMRLPLMKVSEKLEVQIQTALKELSNKEFN